MMALPGFFFSIEGVLKIMSLWFLSTHLSVFVHVHLYDTNQNQRIYPKENQDISDKNIIILHASNISAMA